MNALPDYPEALRLALSGVKPLDQTEVVDLESAASRVLAAPMKADRDLPPFNRAQMDGYAIRASEFTPGKSWRVAHVISAGTRADVQVPPGECVAIATGAALPDDVDTVIQHELSDRGDHRGRAVKFTVERIERWNAVHRRGADAKACDTLISQHTILQPQHLGIVAAVGITRLSVTSKPRVTIVTSGDEVVVPQTPLNQLQPQQIRNSNLVMIGALIDRMGATTVMTRHVPDDRNATVQAVADAIEMSNLVITIGGVSAGERDHFPDAFAVCDVTTSLKGASIQPGRPILVGRSARNAIVVGLPGNPVSALACSCLFVWPIVRVMLGLDAALPWRNVEVAEPAKPNPTRRAFRPAALQSDDRVVVPSWAGSGDLAHTARTDGLLELPVQNELVPAGSRLRFLPWP